MVPGRFRVEDGFHLSNFLRNTEKNYKCPLGFTAKFSGE